MALFIDGQCGFARSIKLYGAGGRKRANKKPNRAPSAHASVPRDSRNPSLERESQ